MKSFLLGIIFLVLLVIKAYKIENYIRQTRELKSPNGSYGQFQTGHKRDFEKFMNNFDKDRYEIICSDINHKTPYYLIVYHEKEKQS